MRGNRAAPRIWETDWLVLRALAKSLRAEVEGFVTPGSLMVDLGCGEEPYAEMIQQLQIDYHGADIEDGADLKIDQHGRVPLPDGMANAVLSVQVLEHVRNLDIYCAEIRRLLTDDGVLLLSTHGSWLYHAHPEDHRRWTRTGLIVDLEDRGLKVDHITALVGPLATTTLIRLTGFAFLIRRIPVLGKVLAGLLATIMNIRAHLEDTVTPEAIRYDNACVFLVRARKMPA